MDAEFWHRKWKEKDIAFHEAEGNQLLIEYFSELGLADDSRIFLPLCGKTLDIGWLLSNNYRVAGVELSETAVQELFAQLGIVPAVTNVGELKHYQREGMDIFVGDIFKLDSATLGAVDATYDRAALVALPEQTRQKYAAHVIEITNNAAQLLLCFEYDQTCMAGPPFSISDAEVERHYGQNYNQQLLASVDVSGGLKGQCVAAEKVWLLRH